MLQQVTQHVAKASSACCILTHVKTQIFSIIFFKIVITCCYIWQVLSKLTEGVVTCYATYCYVSYILLRSLFHICSGHWLCEVAVWTIIPAGYPRALEEPCTTLETIFLVCTWFSEKL